MSFMFRYWGTVCLNMLWLFQSGEWILVAQVLQSRPQPALSGTSQISSKAFNKNGRNIETCWSLLMSTPIHCDVQAILRWFCWLLPTNFWNQFLSPRISRIRSKQNCQLHFTCVLWCKTTHIVMQMKRAKENLSVNVLDAVVCLHWMERVETAWTEWSDLAKAAKNRRKGVSGCVYPWWRLAWNVSPAGMQNPEALW